MNLFNSVVLDVVIGLVFIYLLYSLLATIVNEIIANWLDLRARMLRRALERMLEDHEAGTGFTFVDFFLDMSQNFKKFFSPFRKNSFTEKFYKSPPVKYLAQNKWKSKPSYMGGTAFASTLIQLLRGKNFDGTQSQIDLIRNTLEFNHVQLDPETLQYLKTLLAEAQNDIERFKALLENWFDQTMERTTGWYKKQTQFILFLIGFGMAVAFNIDSIAIYRTLAKDKHARDLLVTMAKDQKYEVLYYQVIDTVKKDTSAAAKKILKKDSSIVFIDSTKKVLMKDLYKETSAIQNVLGLGWTKDSCGPDCQNIKSILKKTNLSPQEKETLQEKMEAGMILRKNPYQKSIGLMLVGWMITALAISLGAPFWFDLLNKIMSIRSSVAKDETPANKGSVPPNKRVG